MWKNVNITTSQHPDMKRHDMRCIVMKWSEDFDRMKWLGSLLVCGISSLTLKMSLVDTDTYWHCMSNGFLLRSLSTFCSLMCTQCTLIRFVGSASGCLGSEGEGLGGHATGNSEDKTTTPRGEGRAQEGPNRIECMSVHVWVCVYCCVVVFTVLYISFSI